MMGRRADPGAEAANRGPEGAVREFLKITPEIEEMVRYTEQPKGLPASELDTDQRALLGRILNLYFDRVPEAIAQHHKSTLDPKTTTFAWAGHLEVGGYHYYRIQSDRLLIEYDNTQNGANHIHSVWRDPVADFGGDVLREHYAAAH